MGDRGAYGAILDFAGATRAGVWRATSRAIHEPGPPAVTPPEMSPEARASRNGIGAAKAEVEEETEANPARGRRHRPSLRHGWEWRIGAVLQQQKWVFCNARYADMAVVARTEQRARPRGTQRSRRVLVH